MSPTVDPEFSLEIVKLAEAVGAKLNELRIKVYAEALSDLTIEQVRAACRLAIREPGKFMPTPGDIRAFVVAPTDDAGLLAYSRFARAASAFGSWSGLLVADHAAAAALTATFGSWPAYCATEDIGVAQKRLEFLASYRDAKRRSHRRGAVLLPGDAEATGSVGVIQENGELKAIPAVTAKELADGHGHEGRLALREAGQAEDGEGSQAARRVEGRRVGQGDVRRP